MSRPCDEDVLLNCVPEAGDPIGNVTVIRQLGWDEEKYWRVRDHLLDAGTLIRGRGKGGSIRRSLAEPEEALPHVAKPTRASTAEGALYEPLLKVLRDEWTREMRIEPD